MSDFNYFKTDNSIDLADEKEVSFPICGEDLDVQKMSFVEGVGLWVNIHPRKSKIVTDALIATIESEKIGTKIIDKMRANESIEKTVIADKITKLKQDILAQLYARIIVKFSGDGCDNKGLDPSTEKFNESNTEARFQVLKQLPNMVEIINANYVDGIDSLGTIYGKNDNAETTEKEVAEDVAKKSG